MGLLPEDQILALHRAALSARLDRTALLAGSAPFDQSIPTVSSPAAQILVDLHCLNDAGALADGSVPLLTWLSMAAQLSAGRSEHAVFEAALPPLKAGKLVPNPKPTYRDAATRALGEELARERACKQALEAAGASAEVVSQRILEIRRKLREGGQLREGDTLGRYTLLERIGRGGFAVVWKAFDTERKSIVAIKVLHANLAGDEIRRERFFRGARMMAELDHPAIVKVLAPAEEDEGFHFFVMEHIDGEDLHHAVVNGRVPRERVLSIVLSIGDALALAHERGLVHRDVKPANILLGPGGEAKLTDFDLVGADDTTGGTRTGAMGTFLYAAPESMEKAKDADARADVFGLAMTAVFALHGQPLPPTVFRHTDAFVDKLDCGAMIKKTLKCALDWDRDLRFADARLLCVALEKSIKLGQPPASNPIVTSKMFERRANLLWIEEDELGWFASFAVGSVVQRMRWIPPGSFLMGSPESEVGRFDWEGPVHAVEVTQGCWLGETPCTQALWEAVMGENPSRFRSSQRPVEGVSWKDCQEFLQKIAMLVPDLGARLPTEAEWECACRAGAQTATWAGDLLIRGQNDAPLLDSIAWYSGNSGVDFELDRGHDSSEWIEKQYAHQCAGTHPVGMKSANPLGLHDMLGNVWEWCEDWYGPYAAGRVVDPFETTARTNRVIRGGSWFYTARDVRAASRNGCPRDYRNDNLGFRLARGISPSQEKLPPSSAPNTI